MNFVVVDIETTGLSFDQNEIIEIGAVKVQEGKLVQFYQQFVKPKNKIPRLITGITGISNEDVAESPAFKQIGQDFLDFLGEDVFVAHNVAFDFKMLNVILKREGFPKMKNSVVDTQDLISLMRPDALSHQLSELIHYFDIPITTSHRALSDAKATAMILVKLLKEIEDLSLPLLFNIVHALKNKQWPLKKYFVDRLESFSINERITAVNWKESLDNFKKCSTQTDDDQPNQKVNQPIEIKEIEKVFKKTLPKKISGYELRQGQQQLSEKITEAFNDNNILLAEAGTGIGKTMGYLIPSILWLQKNKKAKIVISTKTKNLQTQIIEKDIPNLSKLLSKKLKAIAVKGRENYICLNRFEELLLAKKSLQDTIKVLGTLVWLCRTNTGEVEELHPSIRNRYRLNSEVFSCLKDDCPNRHYCFLRNVRQQAKSADLLVVNHCLLLSDIVADSNIIPSFQKLVIDEAHSLEDVATETFSTEVTLAKFVDVLKQSDRKRTFRKKNLEEIFNYFSSYATADNSEVFLEEIPLTEEFKSLIYDVEDKIIDFVQKAQPSVGKQISILWKKLTDIIFQKEGFVSYVHFSKAKAPHNVNLRQFPLNVGELLREYLWADKESVILTSATLTVNQQFGYFQQRMGIDEEIQARVDKILIESPYDQQNMFMALPNDLKNINDEEYLDDSLEKLLYVLKIFKGRTLVLFTSYKMMDYAYEQLNLPAAEMKISILKQKKNESRNGLISRIKKRKDVVIFGTDSFWEGVDIIGDSLSCVVVMKLPFSVPTDPVNKARCDLLEQEGINSFINYIVPRAIIKFRQGVGRLIRSHQDRGAVLIFDNRLITKFYGKIFIKSLSNQLTVANFSEITKKIIQLNY